MATLLIQVRIHQLHLLLATLGRLVLSDVIDLESAWVDDGFENNAASMYGDFRKQFKPL